jgi:hypothetical protein
VPGAHAMQVAWLLSGCTEPGAHWVGSVTPAAQEEPMGQGAQLTWRPAEAWYVPAGQATGLSAAAEGHMEPAGHCKQAEAEVCLVRG